LTQSVVLIQKALRAHLAKKKIKLLAQLAAVPKTIAQDEAVA
jgi:hypothetical protein